ncbi:MAG: LytR C-terminal domain-containing protein [Solirubrobacterales bacterium]
MAAFLGLAVLALLSFTQGRDVRRLREWAGSAPERDAERKESTSAVAAQRAEELRALEESRTAEREAIEEREERRRRREAGLPEASTGERARQRFSGLGERLGQPRYLIGLFVVFVVAVALAAFLVLSGGSDEGAGGGNGKGKQQQQQSEQAPANATPAGEIEVTVLNGTSVSGLAAEIGDMVEAKGFQLGAVGNTAQAYETSVVMYKRGNAPEAKRVAKGLGIEKVDLMTVEVEDLAEGATVAVVVGEDNVATAG